jgi:RNA polymerase sigma factor (sigma-70 family)
MFPYTNKKLLEGILEQNQTALNYLYKSLFPRVKRMIFRYGGDYDTANDIFQESIILLYRKAKEGKLNSTIMVESYIIGISKFVWLRFYNKESERNFSSERNEEVLDESEEEIVNDYRQSRRKKLFSEHFAKLAEDCKNILRLFFNGTSYADIAKELGLGSEEYARRRKYLCKEYLVKSIKSDPQYERLIGDYDEELFETD